MKYGRERRIVVTGLGLVTPLGVGIDANWGKLIEGKSGIRGIQAFDTSDLTCKIAGMVPRGETDGGGFNPDDWVPARQRRRMDPFIVYGIAAAIMAVKDSGWEPEDDEARNRTGVMIGSGIGGLQSIYDGSILIHERGPRKLGPFFIPSALINLVSGHVSITFGFKGPNHAVVTACSTGAHAIGDAARMIMLDDADVMVAAVRRQRFAAWALPGSRRPGRCRLTLMICRRKHRGRGTRAVTASLWARAPASSSLRSMNTQRRAVPVFMRRSWATVCRAMPIT